MALGDRFKLFCVLRSRFATRAVETFGLRVGLRASLLVSRGAQAALDLGSSSHLVRSESSQAASIHGLSFLHVQGVRGTDELLGLTECLFPFVA